MNRISLLLVLLASVFCTISLQAQEQKASDNKVSQQLGTIVSLRLGKTTVANVFDAIAKQTSLKIDVSNFLRERDITVTMEGVSARSALDALTELNDWTWRIVDPDIIVIRKKTLRLPSTPPSIPRLLQIAVPKDIREYFNIPVLGEDMKNQVHRHTAIQSTIRRPTLPPEQRANRGFGSFTTFNLEFSARELRRQSGLLITNELASQLDMEIKIPFEKLSPEQKKALTGYLLGQAFTSTHNDLLFFDLSPIFFNLETLEIKMVSPTSFNVSSVFRDGQFVSESGVYYRLKQKK